MPTVHAGNVTIESTTNASSILERLILRGAAFVLFPVVFFTVVGFAVASLPAMGIRHVLRR